MKKVYLLFIALIVPAILFAQDCPGDINVDNDPGICGAVVTYTAPSPGGATVSQIDNSGLSSDSLFPVGETIQEYELDFGAGVKDTCSFIVTVNDTEPPSLSCPGDILVYNDPGQDGAMVNIPVPYNNNPAITETVDILLLYADYDAHAQDVKARLEATGNFSTIHTFNISSRVPEAAPLIEDYDAILLWRNNNFYEPEELGNVLAEYVDAGGGLVLAVFANSGTTYPSGDFETDQYGVIVPDVIRYGPEAELGEVFLPDHPLMNGVTSFNGGTESYRSWSTTLTPGSYRVADWDDNDYNLPLIAAKENVGPSNARRVDLNFYPPAITGYGKEPWDVNTDGDLILANALMWTASAPTSYDNCSTVEISNDYNEESTPSDYYPVGSTLVTLTASDEAGNTSTCSFNVVVEDNEPPVAVCKDITVSLDENGEAEIEGLDINDGSADNHAIASYEVDPNVFDSSMLGANSVTLTVTDEAGNSSTCTATVQVVDNAAPDVVTNPIEVVLDETGKYELAREDLEEIAEGTTDNGTLFGNLKLSAFPKTFTCENIGETVHVRLTVEDESGNSDRQWTTVTVVDTISPMAVCQDLVVYLDENGEVMITPEEINNGSYDACGIETISLGKETFGCADTGENTVALTVTDFSGNSSTCNALVTVHDTISPTFDPVADIEIKIGTGETETTIDYPEIVVNDNCTLEPELTEGIGPDGLFPVGTTTETWTATDPAGNMATLSFNVTVTAGNSPPVLVSPIADQTVNASYILKVPVSPALGDLFDDPDGDELTISAMLENGDPLPAWAETVDDTILFSPLIADTGCVNIVVQATDPDGATAADTFQLCVDGYPVSAPLVDAADMEVTMYPNPTRDRVNLEMNSAVSGSSEVTVFTIAGTQVLHRKFTDTKNISFSMKNHVSGIYFVKLNAEGKEIVKKLVLDRK